MKDHKCALEILLDVEVVWSEFDELAESSGEASDPASDEQVFLALSKAAILGTP
jgi:hypothetical protein